MNYESLKVALDLYTKHVGETYGTSSLAAEAIEFSIEEIDRLREGLAQATDELTAWIRADGNSADREMLEGLRNLLPTEGPNNAD